MKWQRCADAARLLAPVAVNAGMYAVIATNDWQWVGATLITAAVAVIYEANRLVCAPPTPGDDVEAVAESAGVLRPGHGDGEVDLATVFAELEPGFRALDQRGGCVMPGIEARPDDVRWVRGQYISGLADCTCGSAGTVAAPRRGCPRHGGRS